MTPFAAEISNSISRYITHKAKDEELIDSSKLITALHNYMKNLYPLSFIDIDNKYMCFAFKHKKCTCNKDPNYVEEWVEYVPIHLVSDCKSVDEDNILLFHKNKIDLSKKNFSKNGETYRLRMEYQYGRVYLERVENSKNRLKTAEDCYWSKMSELQNQLQSYTNIKNGFVVFITNHDIYWDEKETIDTQLKICHYDRITLLPKNSERKINPSQIVWIKTRKEDTMCCIGTFDGFFNSDTYKCILPLKSQTTSYESEFNSHFQHAVPYQSDDNSIADKFKSMLKTGRILPSSKNPFEWEGDLLNDYSRLMMSPAVRRMKDKTQVFTMDDSDFVRTRLTHSLEVANIAKLLGLGVEDALSKLKNSRKQITFPNIQDFHIPQILEVAALVHDIGNPPYGHFGEKTIQNFFADPSTHMSERVLEAYNSLSEQQKADFVNFDGNVQGFRVLCHLGLSNDCTSFNLNKVILSTMIKYPFNSIEGNQKGSKDHRKSKFGFFFTEESMYQNICEYLHLQQGQRHPLAYLLEAADDITYIGDDIEDGWKLSYISAADIAKHIERLGENHIQEIFDNKWGDLKFRLLSSDKIKEENAIQSIRIRLQRFMIKRIIAVFCDNVELIIQNKLIDEHQELFNIDETLKAIHDIYWKPLVQKCYDGIHLSQLQGARVLTSLLNTYLEAVLDTKLIKIKTIDNSSNIRLKEKDKKREIVLDNMIKSGMLFETISNNYRDELAPIGQFIPQDNYGKFMLVTDYISGMTDTFAYNRYKALCIE